MCGCVNSKRDIIGLIRDWLDTVYRADSYTRHMGVSCDNEGSQLYIISVCVCEYVCRCTHACVRAVYRADVYTGCMA